MSAERVSAARLSADPAAINRAILDELAALAPKAGVTPALQGGVAFVRGPAGLATLPDEPSLIVACQDERHGYAHRCGALPGRLPDEPPPAVAIVVRIDLAVAAELLLALPAQANPAAAAADSAPAPLDVDTADTVLRLLRTMASPEQVRILAPGIVRELLYRALTGGAGAAVRAAIRRRCHAARIARALRRIHDAYDGRVDVATLARESGMSVTAFHAHFKTVTGTTPIQYLKTTRLHQARMLMARDGISAATASHLVGYESSSQFSREFKRHFGRPPGHDAAALRGALRDARAG